VAARTSDFDFQFPQELISYEPIARGKARLMVVDRFNDSAPRETIASALPDYLNSGDALVLNNTRVIKARLIGENSSGAKVEALLLKPIELPAIDKIDAETMKEFCGWEAMVKPAKRFQKGDVLAFSVTLTATVDSILESGTRILRFNMGYTDFHLALEKIGKVPLPPYIKRVAREQDIQAYQSVFAEKPGSVAAPTASLHLNEEMLDQIRKRGIEVLTVTLHVGAGTFKPVQSESLAEHEMHSEAFEMSVETAQALNRIRAKGGKIWAVGTTAARVLETQAKGIGLETFHAGQGQTSIFIYPGYVWRGVDGLLTNFHWPKSTLFMLVCSLLGTDRAKKIYAEAFAKGYRLFSYGDGMLIR
jgi:S-adenosylmethionine:tRNA ribosyltransferase-isomerase